MTSPGLDQTSANASPARFVFLRPRSQGSAHPALCPVNVEKTRSARCPSSSVQGLEFPLAFAPSVSQVDARSWFAGNPGLSPTRVATSSLQGPT